MIMSQIKKYKFSISNGKYTFYTTIEGSGRFDVEERMKMMYKDCKSIVFMGEVLQIINQKFKLCQKNKK